MNRVLNDYLKIILIIKINVITVHTVTVKIKQQSKLMIDNIEIYIEVLRNIPFYWLILIAFAVTLVENIFPPSPSDIILVAVAIIAGITYHSIIPIIIASTVGSTIGFWIMFSLGKKFDSKIIEADRLKFISKASIAKVENLFQKWGFKLVVANRFMSGTRAVVSFFAGMSGLPLTKTIILSAVSSFLWYGILSLTGYYFGGKDWQILAEYLHIYDKIVITLIILIALIATIFWFIKKRKRKS